MVKRILKKCVVCRKAYLQVPRMEFHLPPHLPPCRVADDPPFTNVGLDFAGPLLVRPDKEAQSSIETLLKVYVLLFTCASARGVHLELTPSLSVSSFLQTFRRFASRRGLPSTHSPPQRLCSLFSFYIVVCFLSIQV